MTFYLYPIIKKLREIRPDEQTRTPDQWDALFSFEQNSMEKKIIIAELEACCPHFESLNLYASELKLENYETMITNSYDLCIHYLVVLRKYMHCLTTQKSPEDQHFHRLWDTKLLQRLTYNHRMLIHWFVISRLKKRPKQMPKLITCFLTQPDLVPFCYRRWYYHYFFKEINTLKSLPEDNSIPHYRGYARGNFCDENNSKCDLPSSLLEAISQDSTDATDIYLTTMNKKWSASIFGQALSMESSNVIRHLARNLTLENGAFSAYDCIIHTIQIANKYNSDFILSVLRIFEEEKPGIIRNYHDKCRNNLLKFLLCPDDKQNYNQDLADYLIQAGCDPDEKNTLGMSFNDFIK